MKVIEYDASRRADVADLMARVWPGRPDERELEWYYERNPVRPASVLLAEDEGRVVGTVAVAFQRMSIDGEEVEVGTAVHLATDPAFRGRGVFSTLQRANEERVRALGVPLLLTVSTDASTSILTTRLGWTELPSLRVWARPGMLPALDTGPRDARGYDRVLRDDAWMRWRFVDTPRAYTIVGRGTVVGRRGRIATIATAAGGGLGVAIQRTRAPAVIAAPPPWERLRYAVAGFVPTPKTFTVLGKSLDGGSLPGRPHFELGDLDFL